MRIYLGMFARWHPTGATNKLPIHEKFIASCDSRDVDREPSLHRGRNDLGTVPCHAAQALIALVTPCFPSADEGPFRIVKVGISPVWIISGMESPLTVQDNHWLPVLVQVEDLCQRWPGDRQKQDS